MNKIFVETTSYIGSILENSPFELRSAFFRRLEQMSKHDQNTIPQMLVKNGDLP